MALVNDSVFVPDRLLTYEKGVVGKNQMAQPDNRVCPFCETPDGEVLNETRLYWWLICTCCARDWRIQKPPEILAEEHDRAVREGP